MRKVGTSGSFDIASQSEASRFVDESEVFDVNPCASSGNDEGSS